MTHQNLCLGKCWKLFWATLRGGRDTHESRILAGYHAFNANVSFMFQAIKSLILHGYVLGRFVNFLVILNSFSQRIGKIYGNGKFWRFGVVLKLEFKLKISRYTPNSCPTTWGAIVGSGNCLVVLFHNLFSPFNISLNFLKFHLKFMCIPALKK